MGVCATKIPKKIIISPSSKSLSDIPYIEPFVFSDKKIQKSDVQLMDIKHIFMEEYKKKQLFMRKHM